MTRNLKALGLALVAVFAMSAMAASAAQASITVTPEKYPAILTGESIGKQIYVPNGEAPTIECSTIGGSATIKAKGAGDTEVTFASPTYTGCNTNLGQPVTVFMEGCDYVFHGGEEDVANHFKNGLVDLVCPGGVTGPKVKIWATKKAHEENKTPVCTLTVWNFTNKGEVTGTNTATTAETKEHPHIPNDFDLKAKEVPTQITGTGVLCSEVTEAKYSGEITMTGFEDKEGAEGARIGATLSKGA